MVITKFGSAYFIGGQRVFLRQRDSLEILEISSQYIFGDCFQLCLEHSKRCEKCENFLLGMIFSEILCGYLPLAAQILRW